MFPHNSGNGRRRRLVAQGHQRKRPHGCPHQERGSYEDTSHGPADGRSGNKPENGCENGLVDMGLRVCSTRQATKSEV
ncbi:hypothetical protein EDC34_1153 [Thermomonas haemolytica]|uniref:Uncharacterized protein n=1 Tax=Thermomonas haemolytica TaxID=141949 RepID=A0A4R3MUW4_9GAMM|nr:hypothetical protein EDC34_1153 [Thermomonas haemolytica]